MPTIEETFWESIEETKDFAAALKQVQDHPELLKLQHSSNRDLPTYLTNLYKFDSNKEIKPLLIYVLTHGKWDFDIKGKITQALISTMYVNMDNSLITLLADSPTFNQISTYKYLKEKVRIATSDASKEKWNTILSLVRDMHLLYALKFDDRGLWEDLYKEGANPLGALGPYGGGKLTGFLFGKFHPNPKLKAWRNLQQEETVQRMEESQADFKKRNEEFEAKKEPAKAQAKQINKEHDEIKVDLTGEANKDLRNRMFKAKAAVTTQQPAPRPR